MKTRALVLALALTFPLALYGIPYAYAATTSSTYTVDGPTSTITPGSHQALYADCNQGDYVTGGGYSGGLTTNIVVSISQPDRGVGWGIEVYNTGSTFNIDANAVAVCQTPITVAGIGVPEFGSLYVAIALGALLYFALSRKFSRGPTMSAKVGA